MAEEKDGAIPTLEELARFAKAPSRENDAVYYRELKARLARHPDESRGLIEQLLKSQDVDTRAWAAVVGTRVFGQDFVPTLVRLLNDAEVEPVALMLLEEVSPASLEDQLPTLRRKLLKLRDGDDAVQVMRVIARLRDVGALPAVRTLTSRPEPFVRKMADVLADYLEHGDFAVLRRIAAHDHEHMVWLCRLAWHLGSAEALEAIRKCADLAPDDDCRKTCGRFARSLESIRSRRQPPFWDISAPE